MKKLNLTPAERSDIHLDFNVNHFIATIGEDGALIGTYMSQARMDADFKANNIVVKRVSSLAYTMALAGYGN